MSAMAQAQKAKAQAGEDPAPHAPLGYVFTDIDASTEKWERTPEAMSRAFARHGAIIDAAMAAHGGRIHDRAGDGVFALFAGADPLAAALQLQLELQRQDWSEVGGLKVRVGIHCDPRARSLEPDRAVANRAARIGASGWGGQIVVSAAAIGVYALPPGCELADLGVHRLKGIDEPMRLFGLIHPELEHREFPPLRTLRATAEALPVQGEPIFGRDEELARLKALLSGETPLVTLVGAGGAGKTRLALEVAAAMSADMLVAFVDLEHVGEAEAFLAAACAALHLPRAAGRSPEELLLSYLREKEALLVLDNADALTGADAVLERLWRSCRGVRLMATRREPFASRGETVVRLGGLEPPRDQKALRTAPAALLFAQRARRFDPGFELQAGDFKAFCAICEAVGANPLALNLVSQWTRFLTLEEIAGKLGEGIGFLDGLASAGTGSLAGVFEGSWDLLGQEGRKALARLAVFEGGFDAGAAKAVADVDIPMLDQLERKCLLERRGRTRLLMHPLIHAFARVKLAEQGAHEQMAHRHGRYVLELAAHAFAEARGAGQSRVLIGFEEEWANLRAAWRHLAGANEQALLRAAIEPVFYGCMLRCRFSEGAALFSTPTADEGLGAYFSALFANCLVQLARYDDAAAAARTALDQAGADAWVIAHAHQALGNLAHVEANKPEAQAHYERALALRRELGDDMGGFYSALSMAWLYQQQGDLEAAKSWVEQSRELCLLMDNPAGLQMVHVCAGDIAASEGRSADAAAAYEATLRLEDRAPHPQVRAVALTKLAALKAEQGELDKALGQFEAAVEIAAVLGDRRQRINTLVGMAACLRRAGRTQSARRELHAALIDAREIAAPAQIARVLLELAETEAEAGEAERARWIGRLADLAGAADAAAEMGLLQLINAYESARPRR